MKIVSCLFKLKAENSPQNSQDQRPFLLHQKTFKSNPQYQVESNQVPVDFACE